MDALISAAARALAAGDALGALKRVALREDPPALALRGVAMAQLGNLARARALLEAAARAFGPKETVARARCELAEAEIALVSRDLGRTRTLGSARAVLAAHGDAANAAHAGYLEARRLLLIGRLEESGRALETVEPAALLPASRAGYWLVAAGIAMRRIRAASARAAIEQAERAARQVAISALAAEVDRAARALEAPAARMIARGERRALDLSDVETLIASGALVVDACRNAVRAGQTAVPLAGRPVLFRLARCLAEAWPEDAPRETLIARAFNGRVADESHRVRLRVEIGRLRKALGPLAALESTRRGFILRPQRERPVAVLLPPVEEDHAEVLALLADGEAWSSSALALALDVIPRTVQRALEALAGAGKAGSFGRGRARRWMTASVPGFPTSLLLPASLRQA
jgi:hypothetical protein